MDTAHCLGHSGSGQWTGTAGDLCPAGCRYSLCQPRWGHQSRGTHQSRGALPGSPPHPHTHGDSSAGQPAHGSQACSGHSAAPPCGVSSAGIAPTGGHRHPGPWGQCSHCTHMVGTRRLALMGPQSARGHKLRIAALPTVGGGGWRECSAQLLHPGPVPAPPRSPV